MKMCEDEKGRKKTRKYKKKDAKRTEMMLHRSMLVDECLLWSVECLPFYICRSI